MRLLIAGCGDLGGRIGQRWLIDGGEVVALRRRADLLPPALQPRALDLARPLPAGALDGEFDAVASVASAGARSEAAYRSAYIDGPRHLLAALPRPPSRFLFASSTAVYGEDAGGWVDESSPADAASFNGRLLVEAAAALAAAAPCLVVARLSGLYGPGRDWMLRRARAGESGAARWTNRVHIDDAAAACVHLLRHPAPPSLVCVSDDLPAREDVVLAFLREALDLPPVAGADVDPTPVGKRVGNRRLRASGFSLRWPDFRRGYAAAFDLRPAGPALL
jgi:nucleoside-diphosphate-sugar epimerase